MLNCAHKSIIKQLSLNKHLCHPVDKKINKTRNMIRVNPGFLLLFSSLVLGISKLAVVKFINSLKNTKNCNSDGFLNV